MCGFIAFGYWAIFQNLYDTPKGHFFLIYNIHEFLKKSTSTLRLSNTPLGHYKSYEYHNEDYNETILLKLNLLENIYL